MSKKITQLNNQTTVVTNPNDCPDSGHMPGLTIKDINETIINPDPNDEGWGKTWICF